MGKLAPMSAREVIATLSEHGFVEVRRRASHIVMQKRTGDSTITVIVPDYREIRTGTLASIVRQSRLPRSVFER